MHRSLLVLSLATLLPSWAGAQQSIEVRQAASQSTTVLPLMTNQRAVHGPSRMGGMTSSHDGRWLFQAEGTTLVILQTGNDNGPHDESRMQRPDGNKRVPFGAEGFTVARMMLDPEADLVPGPNSPGQVENLLFLAAGRSGLWVMEADVTIGVQNRAWRIDDSMNSDPATQDGERWCCDVDVATVQGVDYVVALFGSKSDSRLRLYELSKVRAVADPANPNTELGHELAPDREFVLGDHPEAPQAPPQPSYGRSVALGMDVDVSGPPGQERADVYVALGSHGLARVTFSAPPTPGVRWGPIFGTGSTYASGMGHPADKSDELYGDLVIEDAAKYTDPDPVMRRDFPVFCDVAVFRGTTAQQESVHHLYVAVDHLFWLVFDLDAEVFDRDMPILHHAGTEIGYTQLYGTAAHKVVAPSPGDGLAGCARELKIARHPVHGPYLVVTTAGINFVKDFSTPTEGYVFDAHLEWAGGRGRINSKQQTQWYPIRASYPAGTSYAGVTPSGGNFLHVPTEQVHPDAIEFACVGRIAASNDGPRSRNGVGLYQVPALPGGPAPRAFERSISHSGGRQSFALGVSKIDPDLILTGGNDGAVPKDGFLALGPGATGIKRHYRPIGVPRSDERGVGGFFLDTGSQWQEPGQLPFHQYLFCSGANRGYLEGTPPFWTLIRWQLLELEVPFGDAYANSPVRKRWWYVTPPRDGFGNFGFLWYMNAYVNPEFDAFLQARGVSERLAFATHVRTAEGLTVIDRDELMAHAQTQENGRELHLDSGSVATSSSLVTHPEFNDMPRNDATLRNFWQGYIQGNEDDTSVSLQWMPALVEVQHPNRTDFGRWVLAVPCGQIYANPDWDIYTDPGYGNPAWQPDPGTVWNQKYSHGLVQFWEVAPNPAKNNEWWPLTSVDPGLDGVLGTGDDVNGNSPLRKIISPDPDVNIWKVVPLRMTVGSVERVFLVCVDFAGHVYVYSIEDILDVPVTDPDGAAAELDASFRVAEWTAPLSLYDDLQTNVFDVAVDHRGGDKAMFYVAVRRVGVVLLEFDPGGPTPLVEVARFQTPDFPGKIEVRQDNDTLIVNDYGGGIRVYGE